MNETACPECGDRMPTEARACACGWTAGGRHGQPAKDPHRHRCAMTSSAGRCPQPGTISSSIGEEARYFCRWHWRALGNPTLAARLVEDLQRDPPPRAGDWRDRAVDEEMVKLNLFRREGESLEQYRQRGRELYRHALEKRAATQAQYAGQKQRKAEASAELALEKLTEHAARLEADGHPRDEAERIAMAHLLADAS